MISEDEEYGWVFSAQSSLEFEVPPVSQSA
jgi:hypothetical protein